MTLPIEAVLTVDGEPALFSGPARQGVLRLTNTGPLPIVIDAIDPQARTDSGHSTTPPAPLTLHMPAGTLSPESMAGLRAGHGWVVTVAADGRTDGPNRWDVVRFTSDEPVTITPGEALSIPLTGLAAAPRGRARHSRLVIDYACALIDSTGTRRPLIGSRAFVLYLVPWHHSPAHLHLMAGVVAGAEVLNRAEKPNEIELRISPDTVLGSVEFRGGQTELRLSWDVGSAESRWWALCTPAEADAAQVELHWLLDPDHVTQGQPPPEPISDADVRVSPTSATWSVVVPTDISLREGDHLAIRIANLYTAHRSGPANLYLDVVGVGDGSGGAVSGTFVLPVHKQAHRWAGGDGLTIVAGSEEPSLQARDEFGRLAMRIRPSGRGHAFQLFVNDPDHPELEIVGAELSSDGDAHVSRGLTMGGPLRIGSNMRVGGDGNQLAVTAQRGDGTWSGSLRISPPDDDRDYRLDVRSNKLHASGDMGIAGGLTIGGPLGISRGGAAITGPLAVTGDASISGALKVTGMVDASDLRVGGSRPMAIVRHTVTVNQPNPTGMTEGDWEAVLSGSPKATLTIAGTVHLVPIRLFSESGRWMLETDLDHALTALPFVGLPLSSLAAAATGNGVATVLYFRRAFLARGPATNA